MHNIKRAVVSGRPRRRPAWPIWLLGGFIVLLFVLQLAATPLARSYSRHALGNMRGFEGRVGDVHASVFPPRLAVVDLTMIERPGGSWRDPLLHVERLDLDLAWRKLLRGALVADVVVQRPRIAIVQRSRSGNEKSAEAKGRRLPDLEAELERQAPLEVARLQVQDGEVQIVDQTRHPTPTISLTQVDLSLDDLATRAALVSSRPTLLRGHARLQNSGEITARASADPWHKGLTFEGQFALKHLRVADLGNLVQATTDLRPSSGTVDLYTSFQARNGRITGGVKPMLHDVRVAPADPSAWTRLKAWVADDALALFARHPEGQREVATIVPIEGTIKDPDAQPWPTLVGVVRNAFVEGLTRGFEDLPPQTAPKKEGPLQQLVDALHKKNGPPRAQPSEHGASAARHARRPR